MIFVSLEGHKNVTTTAIFGPTLCIDPVSKLLFRKNKQYWSPELHLSCLFVHSLRV